MAIDYSFIGRDVPPLDLQQQPVEYASVDPQQALVERLLASLEPNPPPPPPHLPPAPTGGRQILGNIGDALRAMAAVRTGAQPPQYGPFATSEMARKQQAFELQHDYEKRAAETAAANRVMRNNARISLTRAGVSNQLKQRAFQLKQFQTLDENKRPVTVPYNYNPNTGTLEAVPGNEAGFEKYIRPFLAQGINEDTGKAEYRLIEPFPSTPGGTSNTGTRNFEPLPPPGLATEAGGKAAVLTRFPQIMDVFQKAADDVGSTDSTLNQVWNWFRAQGARTSVGPIVAPESLVNYYRSVRSALFPIVKAGSGAVFPEAELRRWESRFPVPGVDTPTEAAHAWDTLIQEIISDVKGKYGAAGRTPPPMKNPSQANDPLLDELWGGGK